MSEQTPNHEFDTQNPKAAQSNIDREDSVLEESLQEFDPKVNSGMHNTIENEIDIHAFEARIAELEGEVKQAKESTARANAETYNAQKRMEQEAAENAAK